MGNKIHSYQRVSPSAQGKGKGVASATDLDPEREDVIEYEVYHVGICLLRTTFSFLLLTTRLVDMGYPGIQGVPPENANIHSPLHRGRFVHRGRRINLGVRGAVSLSPPLLPLDLPSQLL